MKVTDFVPKVPGQTKGKTCYERLREDGKPPVFFPRLRKLFGQFFKEASVFQTLTFQ